MAIKLKSPGRTSVGPRVYLHIGYGKTGSSAIQSYLARNTELLSDFGVDYPRHASLEDAKNGFITSGNLNPSEYWVDVVIKTARTCQHSSLVFSNEGLYGKILEDANKLIHLSSVVNLKIILYLRDPFDLLYSMYGQQVKRGGETRDIVDFLPSFIRYYKRTIGFLNFCKENSIEVLLQNYSRIDQLELNFISLILGRKAENFYNKSDRDIKFKINRSLTRSELEFQRQFNRFYGASSSEYISDQLVNRAPEIPSEIEEVDQKSLDLIRRELESDVACLNSILDTKNQILLHRSSQVENLSLNMGGSDYSFTQKQLAILAESLSSRISKIQDRVLVDGDADKLRNIAMKYETGGHLTLEDARYLMEKARCARPNGPLILKKLKEFLNIKS